MGNLGSVLFLVTLFLASSAAGATTSVPGFDLPEDGIAFHNYEYWSKSKLPRKLQVAHCTGMALLVRQVFNFGEFQPNQPKLSAAEYEPILRKIFQIHTRTLPGSVARVAIPGYANFRELTKEPGVDEAIKNVLGDALNDVRRPNFNWLPWNAIGDTKRSRSKKELALRRTIDAGRPATLYLTDNTKTAHAVLLYNYEATSEAVYYDVYDSNHPEGSFRIHFSFKNGRFYHSDWGWRDPWILHPYAGE